MLLHDTENQASATHRDTPEREESIISPEFLHFKTPTPDLLSILKISREEWDQLKTYAQVHANEFFTIISTLPVAPKSVLEWGSGFSTYILSHYCQQWQSNHLLSIDHIQKYQDTALARLNRTPFLEMKTIDLTGAIWPWDKPGFNYATYPMTIEKKFDLIFVDGRRRNECLLVASNILASRGIVILHDVWRERYKPGTSLFEPIRRFDDYLIMKKREP